MCNFLFLLTEPLLELRVEAIFCLTSIKIMSKNNRSTFESFPRKFIIFFSDILPSSHSQAATQNFSKICLCEPCK